jgi:hypothetical protein
VAGLAEHHHPRVADAVQQDVEVAGIGQRPGEPGDLLAVSGHARRVPRPPPR